MASNRNPEEMKRERESMRDAARASHLASVSASVGKRAAGAPGREVEPVLARDSKSVKQPDHRQLSANMGGAPDSGKTSTKAQSKPARSAGMASLFHACVAPIPPVQGGFPGPPQRELVELFQATPSR